MLNVTQKVVKVKSPEHVALATMLFCPRIIGLRKIWQVSDEDVDDDCLMLWIKHYLHRAALPAHPLAPWGIIPCLFWNN